MTTHNLNSNTYSHRLSMNFTTSNRLPLHRLRLHNAIVMTCLTMFFASVLIVHASTNAQGSPSFRVSQPAQIGSRRGDSSGGNKLLALNVGSSSTIGNEPSLQQRYPYKDEDFVIPTIKEQQRYIQSYLQHSGLVLWLHHLRIGLF
jgi:hypothetical protein